MTERDQITYLEQRLKDAETDAAKWESAYNGVRIELRDARDKLESVRVDFALIEAHRNEDNRADLAAMTARAERAERERDLLLDAVALEDEWTLDEWRQWYRDGARDIAKIALADITGVFEAIADVLDTIKEPADG